MSGILITAVGAPPGLNVLRALHETGKYRLVAADANPAAPGLCTSSDHLEPLPQFFKRHFSAVCSFSLAC